MAKLALFTPTKTACGWRLNIPPKFSDTGERRQLFYRTKELAKQAADTMKERVATFGQTARAIAPSLAERATAAEALLRPYGLDVLEAARIVAAIRQREAASCPVEESTAAWLASCAALRDRTRKNYRLTAERIDGALAGRVLATVTAEDLQAVLAPPGRTVSSALENLRNAKAWWRYSAGRGWCDVSIFGKVEFPKASREQGEISVLTPDEAEQLLRVAAREFPQAVPAIAVQLFAGCRVEEVERLDSHNFSPEGIELGAEITKRGRRRFVAMNPTLGAWLAAFPFEPCANWRATFAAVRRLCGWDVSSVILNDRLKAGTLASLPPVTRGRWEQNVLRHSHASYAVAHGAKIDDLLFSFGHSGSTDVLRNHYAGKVRPKEAIRFFSIAPEGVKIQQLAAV
jgi:site-specific recombinase XerD